MTENGTVRMVILFNSDENKTIFFAEGRHADAKEISLS